MDGFNQYRGRRSLPAQLVLALIFLVVLLSLLVWRSGVGFSHPAPAPRAVTPRGDLAEAEKSTIELFREASPSVVHITPVDVEISRDLSHLNVQEIPKGTGSGFIWDTEGHVVTNYHVVMDADAFQVLLADRTAYKAELIGVAKHKDLAVLKINAPASKLRPILLGSSEDLQVGQSAFAIGNPFGLDQTLTTGVISALGREIQSLSGTPITGVIQTSAAINPGNSGGPLLDSAGRLIGVNTQIYSPSGAFVGVGFAIPVETVNLVVPELIAHGKIVRPGLGVEISEALSVQAGLPPLTVWGVQPGGGAAQAGIQPVRQDSLGRLYYDVILAINGTQVTTFSDLFAELGKYKAGDTVSVTMQSDGRRRDVKVTLQPLD